MTHRIELGEHTKTRLEELQAKIRLRTGQEVTQKELLTRLINDASRSPEGIIASFRETTVPLSDAEIEVMNRGRVSSGGGTIEADIDETLY